MKVVPLILLFLAFEGHLTSVVGAKKKKTSTKSSKKSKAFVGKLDTNLCVEYVSGLPSSSSFKMTPKEAIKWCEEDLQCAGFTYKGAKDLGQKFAMKFFHYIPEVSVADAKTLGDWTWTSYKVSRPFVLLNIFPEDKLLPPPQKNTANEKSPVILFNLIQNARIPIERDENFDLRNYLDMTQQSSKWMMKIDLSTKESLTKPMKRCISQKT